MRLVDLERVARVEAIHGIGRDQQRPIDAHGIHRGHHVVARDLRRPVEMTGPGTAGMVALVAMDLGVDDRHEALPDCASVYGFRCANGGDESNHPHPPVAPQREGEGPRSNVRVRVVLADRSLAVP